MASKSKFSVKDAIALAFKLKKKKSLSWYDKLDTQKREWCDSLKKEYESGSCDHVPFESLRSVVNENLSLSICDHSFRSWLKSTTRPKRKRS